MAQHGVLGRRYAQLEYIGPSASASLAWMALARSWIRVFSFMETLIADQGNEIKGEFEQNAAEAGVYHHIIDARAPHQNGRTERVGGLFKAQITLALDEKPPANEEEHRLLVWHCIAARNRYANRSGFSRDHGSESSGRRTDFLAPSPPTI